MNNKALLVAILIICSSAVLYVLWNALPYLLIFGGLSFAVYYLFLKDKIKDMFDD